MKENVPGTEAAEVHLDIRLTGPDRGRPLNRHRAERLTTMAVQRAIDAITDCTRTGAYEGNDLCILESACDVLRDGLAHALRS